MVNKLIADQDSVKKTRLILETALSNVCEKASNQFEGLPLIRWQISKDSTIVNLLDTKKSEGGGQANLLITIKVEAGRYSLKHFENKQELLDMLIQEVKRLSANEGIGSYNFNSVKIFSLPNSNKFTPEADPSKILQNMDQSLPVDELVNIATRRMMNLKIITEDTISLRAKDALGNDLWEIYENAMPLLRQLGASEDGEFVTTNSASLKVALSNTKNSKPTLVIRRLGGELHISPNTKSGNILLAFLEHAILENLLGSARRDLNG